MNAIHGKSLDIILDDDPAWKYHGRVKVERPNINVPFTRLPVNVVALPYKEYLRSLADEWLWDETDFGSDENLYDGGYTDVAIGADSSTYSVFLPYSPCGGTITATVNVTGFYGSTTSGYIQIRNSNYTTTYKSISATGEYTVTATAAYDLQSRKIRVYTYNLVGTITIDYTPRSL